MHWALLQGTRIFPDCGADRAAGKAVTSLQLPPHLWDSAATTLLPLAAIPPELFFLEMQRRAVDNNKNQELESRNT